MATTLTQKSKRKENVKISLKEKEKNMHNHIYVKKGKTYMKVESRIPVQFSRQVMYFLKLIISYENKLSPGQAITL